MKIEYVHWRGNVEISSIRQAVSEACIPDAYSYEGELEGIKAQNEKLKEVLSRLVECLYGEQKPKHEALQYILGPGYEVNE